MKNWQKLGLSAMATVGAIWLGKNFLWDPAKKEVEEEIKEEQKVVKDAGLKPEKVTESPSEKKSFVENLLHTLIYKADKNVWEDELFRTYEYESFSLEKLWGSIRILQKQDQNKKDLLSIMIQVPPYHGPNKRTISDYRRSISETVENFLQGTDVRGLRVGARGYFEYFDEDEDGGYYYTEEITQEDCEEFSDRGYFDGLSRLVTHFFENGPTGFDNEENLISVSAFIEIQLPIAKNKFDTGGMDIIKTVALLKELVFNLNIMNKGCSMNISECYPPIIFHPDLDSLDTFYHVELSENNVITGYYPAELSVEEFLEED